MIEKNPVGNCKILVKLGWWWFRFFKLNDI